jgi:predicted AAA+ superfamily ATPase
MPIILANLKTDFYFAKMLSREILPLLTKRLHQFDSVALIGPRQVGKTTLARHIADAAEGGARYIDLERPADRRLLDDADAYFSAHAKELIVLDEVQRAPEIFRILRGQIDERRRMGVAGGQVLILGSASLDLLRQSSESLAGRISYLELRALNAREVALESDTSLDRLWIQGGFPPSYVREDGEESLQWRRDFIQTYLERDLPQFGFNVDSEQIDRFCRMLANDQGELFNAERYARSLGVSGHTVTRYLDMLEKLLLVRVLRPWSANTGKRLVKSPRPFVRDSGLLHALLDLRQTDDVRRHSVAGKSWEGFVIENLIGAAFGRAKPYFYRSSGGAEADLVLEFAPGRCWAIEVKLSGAPTIDRGFHNAADDVGAERRLLVYKGSDCFPMRGGVEAMPLTKAMNEISAAVQA